MRRTTKTVLALVLAGLLAATAWAQFGTTTPLAYHEVSYLRNEALHKELKLTAEQVKKLNDYPDKWFADYRSKSRGKKNRDEPVKTAEKFLADNLDATQRLRLRQVVLQQLAARPGNVRGGTQLPKAALDDLNLTAEQRAKLRESALQDVLTRDQKKQWETVVGPPFKETLTTYLGRGSNPFGPGSSGFPARNLVPQPERMLLLESPAVGKELGLSDVQRKRLAEALRRWEEDTRDYPTWATADRTTLLTLLGSAYERSARAALQEKQAERLEQIVLQRALRSAGERTPLHNRTVQAKLTLTDEQRRSMADIERNRTQELAEVFLTGEDSTTLVKKVAVFHQKTREQLEGVLSAEQRKTLPELTGVPFTGEVPSPRSSLSSWLPGSGVRDPESPAFVSARQTALSPRLAWLAQESVQAELKLSAEQKDQITGLLRKWLTATRDTQPRARARERTSKVPEANREAEEVLKKLLPPAQAKRLEQILLQYVSASPGAPEGEVTLLAPVRREQTRANLQTVLRYPTAARELALTEAQRRSVGEIAEDAARTQRMMSVELGGRFGSAEFRDAALANKTVASHQKLVDEKLQNLLTPKQKGVLKELLGEPFKGDLAR